MSGYTGTEKNITVPAQIEGIPVTSIGAFTFEGSQIERVEVENGIQSISDKAFYKAGSLVSVHLPDSVTEIISYAFMDCVKLADITLSKNYVSVGNSAFENTAWFNNQPDGVTYIGNVAYEYKGAENMAPDTKIVLREGTDSISPHAFSNCANMTAITIPQGVRSIGSMAFASCTGLKSVVIPQGVEKLESSVFIYCENLEEITIPDSITSMSSSAFAGTKWERGQKDGLVYAGRFAYKYKGTISENVSIEIKEGTYGLTDNLFRNCANLKNISLPESLNKIGSCTFAGSGLEKISIPSSVAYIAEGAFMDCANLTEIRLPDAITEIPFATFWGCVNLKSVVLPDKLETIAERAFLNCKSLKSIAIPKSIVSIKWPALGFLLDDDPAAGLMIDDDFSISGYAGTDAERYAAKYGIPFSALDEPQQIGDIDGNGEINTADVLELQKYLAKQRNLNAVQRPAADTDRNGKIELNDILRIQLHLAKKIVSL